MKSAVRRLRMFAGPNGSGKSTIRPLLQPELLGVYINPDDLTSTIHTRGYLPLTPFQVTTTTDEVQRFFAESALIRRAQLNHIVTQITHVDGAVHFAIPPNSTAYVASVMADFLRRHLIASHVSFSFETVMSSPDKVDLLHVARENGFRRYLYFVATEDPAINISRVRYRVKQGGHDVPEDKIISRYFRSLALLHSAIRSTERAYIFDNSGADANWIAEITDGKVLQLRTNHVPRWFQDAVMDRNED